MGLVAFRYSHNVKNAMSLGYQESAGFFWSICKPSTAGNDIYNFNQKCDEFQH